MNKSEVILKIADKAGTSKAAVSKVIDAFSETLREALASGDDVRINGVGVFSISNRAARKGSNPQTGEALVIPAKKVVKFKPASALQDSVQ